MAALKPLTRAGLTALAAVLFALGWLAGALCGVCVWAAVATKLGWVGGWRGMSRGPAR